MLMQLKELKYRADMSVDPTWERRYRAALRYDLRDPVDLDLVDRILGGEVVQTALGMIRPEQEVDPKVETWRDRAIREPLF